MSTTVTWSDYEISGTKNAEADEIGKDALCPTKWLGWCFENCWLLSLVPLAFVLLYAIIVYIADPDYAHAKDLLEPLRDWSFNVFAVLITVVWLVFRRMLRLTPRDLTLLVRSGRLVSKDMVQPGAFAAELNRMIRMSFSIGRGGRIVNIAAWQMTTFLVVGLVMIYIFEANSTYPWLEELMDSITGIGRDDYRLVMRNFVAALQWALAPLFWAFPVGAGVWVVLATGISLTKLTRIYYLDPIAGHPDSSGGLRKLGDICFRIALASILPQVVTLGVAVYGVTQAQADLLVSTMAAIVSILFTVLAIPSFAYPMWRIHTEMVLRREAYEKELAQKIVVAEGELRLYFNMATHDAPKLDAIQKTIETLHKLHPAERDFPTWPFSRNILFAVGPNILVPLATLLLPNLPPNIIDALRGILGITVSIP